MADWEVDAEEPAGKAWEVESEQPIARRGGVRSEFARTSTLARDAAGPTQPDPLTQKPDPRQPLPDGVTPSAAGAGRGVVNPMRAAVQRADAPFQNRDEAINDAVDRIELGAPAEDVFGAFERMGIGRQEIIQRGAQLGGKAFAPQTTRPANNELLAGPTGFDEVRPVEPSALQEAGNTVRRGAEQFKQSVDSARFLSGGIDASQMAEAQRVGQRRMGALAPSGDVAAGLDRLQDANKTGEWGPVLSAIAQPQNWKALASLVTESAVSTAPMMLAGSLAMALGGVAAGMPVTTATSFAQEYAAALGDELEKRGIDASDPVKVATALQDPDLRQAIDQRGKIRGAAVGAFDGITMGFAGALGRALHRAQAAGTLTKGQAIRGAAAGAGVEMAGGGLGEFIGQKGVGESKPLDVAVEIAAEGPSGVVDVATSFLTPRSKAGQPTLPPTQLRTDSINRFGEMAAAFGLPEKAVARAREAAANMPAGDVPAFLAKLADAYNKRGMFAKPLEPQAVTELQAAIDGPPPEATPTEGTKQDAAVSSIESTLKAAGALPDEALAPAGLADEQPAEPPKVEGEKINREWSTFAPESGTLGIPRSQMPQIAAEHRGALVNFLNARGVAHQMEEVDPATLKPTQAEFQPKKVAGIAESGNGRSILVSGDGHVLDGHHQWKAALDAGRPVRAVILDAPIQDLLRLSHQFPSSTTARGPSKTATAAPQASAADNQQGAADGQAQEEAQGLLTNAPADVTTAGATEQAGVRNDQPELPDPARLAAGTPDERGAAGARSSGDQRPGADVANGRGKPAAAPVPGGREAGAVGDGGGSDAALKVRELVAPTRHQIGQETAEDLAALLGHKLERKGSISWADIPSDIANRIGTSESIGLKDAMAMDPVGVVKALGGKASSESQQGADQSRFPHIKTITGLSMGPGGRLTPKPIAQGKALHRETNLSGLDDLLRLDGQADTRRIFVTDNPDLAIGQGDNKGVQVTFRPDSLSGTEHRKPMTGDVSGREYETDFSAPRAVQTVTMAADDVKKLRGLTKRALADFDREDLPDGRVRFHRKGIEWTPTEGVARRVIGKYGQAPGTAQAIELRPNDDGTLTPHTGKYPMVDFESGAPIKIPGDATDAQAAEAIRKAGALTSKDKFYGVKPDEQAKPAPTPERTEAEKTADLRRRIDGLKALLACLQS